MVKIEQSVVIDRPIEEVFAFVTDIEKFSQWSAELVEARKTSEGPVGVGTTFSGVVQLLGRRMHNTHEVTEYEPNRKLSFRTITSPVPMEAEVRFESIDNHTTVTTVAEVQPGGFFRLAAPIFRRMVNRQYETNLANLKDLLEAQG